MLQKPCATQNVFFLWSKVAFQLSPDVDGNWIRSADSSYFHFLMLFLDVSPKSASRKIFFENK